MDADIGMSELELIYMKGAKAHRYKNTTLTFRNLTSLSCTAHPLIDLLSYLSSLVLMFTVVSRKFLTANIAVLWYRKVIV